METIHTKSVETKIKYLGAFCPLFVNLITLCIFIASVKYFYSGNRGKVSNIYFRLYIPSMFGCWFIFPGMALLQFAYSLYLLCRFKIPLFCCHLSSAIGLGICFLIFILLMNKGFFMTV
jgi:hypothetical protein